MDYVTIKSYQNGLALHIKDAPFDEILAEIEAKFKNSRQFFGKAKLALSLTGMALSSDEEIQIIDCIHLHSDLRIIALIGKGDKFDDLFTQTIKEYEYRNPANHTTLPKGSIYSGTLRTGQELILNESIIVLGDVNHGAKIETTGDIIVLGAIYGDVKAGRDDESGHFIAALEMAPERLRIGTVKYKKRTEKRFWPDSNKNSPKIAALQEHEIVVKPITKETLGEIIR